MRLLFEIHPESLALSDRKVIKRETARGIVLRSDEILLTYTKRYNDYSFPGGGVEAGEARIVGLKRELAEETGARNIQIVQEFGYVNEYRPHDQSGYNLLHIQSYFYVCEIDAELGSLRLESYEIANGVEAKWINIFEAIRHNRAVISAKEKSMGLSIFRETLALERVAQELLGLGPIR